MREPTQLLYKSEIPINNHISVRIPTLREIVNKQDDYYTLVNILTAMPIDMMVELDDLGIDFTEIDDYDLFLMFFKSLENLDMSLVLTGVDVSKFELAYNEDINMYVMVDRENDIVIDRIIHHDIAACIRKINQMKKDKRKPGNEEAKKYLIERARIKANRRKRKPQESQLEQLIIAMVNTEQFKYNLDSVLDLTIFQFNECVRQIVKKTDYDNRMIGVFAGTVDASKLKSEELNWLTHK